MVKFTSILRNGFVSITNFFVWTALVFSFSACGDKNYVLFSGSAPAQGIVGSASMFSSASTSAEGISSVTLSAPCSSANATIHAIDENGAVVNTALASSAIDSNGGFVFSSTQIKSLKFSLTNIRYVIKAEGCGSTYYRPLTNYKSQDITGISTLLTMSSEVTDSGRRNLTTISREELENAILQFKDVKSSLSLSTLLENIISTPTLAQEFQTVTNLAPVKLKEAPPTSLDVTAPLAITEAAVNSYGVTIHHWNPDYQPAYEWRVDGVTVGTNSSFQWNTGKNSQGTHELVLKVGTRKLDGTIDTSKTVKTETFPVVIENTFPATAPSLELTSGAPPVTTRAVTMNIDTGTDKLNCATFSALALTENSPTAPTEFPISCATAGTQPLSYTSVSPNDGVKVLRLWAVDSSGNVSSTPTALTVIIDTTAPVPSFISAPALINNLASLSITFSAIDDNAINAYRCKIDGGSYSSCSSPKSFSGLSEGAHTFYIKVVDSVGNESAALSTAWATDLTLPAITLSGTPAAIVNQLTNTFTFSGTDTAPGIIAGYLCAMDAGSYTACASPKMELLAPGSHNFQVKSFDNAGNQSAPQSFSFTIDTTVPTVSITSHPVALTNSTAASFSFAGADTGGGTIASYACSLDGSSYTTCTSPQALSALTSGSHTFSVKSVDSAGNLSSAATYSWTVDLTTPVPNISASPGNITNSATADFSFISNNPPGGTITGYQCKLDSAAFSSCSSPLQYTALTEGTHAFQVRSVDNNSSLSAATTVTWILDLTNPVATIDAYPSNLNTNTSTAIYFSATDSGGGAVAIFQCKLDSGAYAPCSSPKTYSSLGEGAHLFSVKVSDTAANVSTVTTTAWTTDLTGPTINLSGQPSNLTNSTSGTFTFAGTDTGGGAVAGYECSLDGADFYSCASPRTYASLAPGAHSILIRATDSVGNVGVTASANWTIDTTAPTVSITLAPQLNSNSTSASFQFSGTDTGGGAVASYECSIDAGAFVACSSPKNYSSLSNASHTFAVRAIDTAGNTGSEALQSWTVDTVAPVLTITTPATNNTVILSSNISNASFGGACETGLTITFSGLSTGTMTCSGGVWNRSVNLSTASEGALTLTASQTDSAGNITSVNRTVIKDTTAPVINLTSVPTGYQKAGNAATVQFAVTELNITTAQSFTVSYSTDDGSNWTTAGNVTSTTGPLSSSSFSLSFTLPSVDSTQVKVKVTGSDVADNSGASSVSAAFTVDKTIPSISSFQLAGGVTTVAIPTVTFNISASDNLSTVSHYQFSESASYSAGGWIAYSGTGTYTLSQLNGTKIVSLWVKDGAGNVSAASTYTITLSTSLPTTTLTSPLTTDTFTTGQTVNISWTCSSADGLDPAPISFIKYTVDDGANFLPITTNLTNNSSATSGTYAWTLPSGVTVFRLLISCKSASGVVANAYSPVINTGGWSVYAGDPWYGKQNVAASIARVVGGNNRLNYSVTGDENNNIYYVANNTLMKIDAVSGYVTAFSGSGATGCTAGTGVSALTGTFSNPIILGMDSAHQNLFLSDSVCLKIFKINVATGVVTTWETLPTSSNLDTTADNGGSWFLTKNRILIFYTTTARMYRMDLTTQNATAIAITGNGTTPSISTNNRYAIGTSLTGAQMINIANGMNMMATDDASKIWVAPMNFGNYMRYDWNGTEYVVGVADGGSLFHSYRNCTATDFDAYIYCTDRAISPAGRTIRIFNPTTQTFTSNSGSLPFQDNYNSANLVAGAMKDRLVVTYSANSIDTVVPAWSGAWQYTHIAGVPLTTMGNGTDLTQVGLDSVTDIKYNISTNSLWIGNTQGYARRVVYSGGTATVSTVYTSSANSQYGASFVPNLAGNKFIGYVSCARNWVVVDTFNSAAPATFVTPQTLVGGVCNNTTYITAAYPVPSGTPYNQAYFVSNMDTYQSMVYHSSGTAYFATHSASGSTNDNMIYSSDGTTVTRVAGVVGAGTYISGDNGALASGVTFKRIWHLQEIRTGTYQGDILIWDADRLRRISVSTEPSAPRVYDLYSMTMATAYTAGTSFYDIYYDSTSETSGILGSGTVFYSSTNGTIHKFVPDSALTSAVDTTYTFTGTTIGGSVRLTLHPTAGLLILQKGANRILRIAP